MQTKDGEKHAVSFSPKKKSAIDNLAIQKSPGKITKFKLSTKFEREAVQILKYTEVVPLSSGEKLDFKSDKHELPITLASLSNGQLLNVKGKVIEMSQPQKCHRNVYITDLSGHTKIVFWEELVDQVETGRTYSFEAFHVKKYREEVYLNNPKDEEQCSLNEVSEFAEELPLDDPHAALSNH